MLHALAGSARREPSRPCRPRFRRSDDPLARDHPPFPPGAHLPQLLCPLPHRIRAGTPPHDRIQRLREPLGADMRSRGATAVDADAEVFGLGGEVVGVEPDGQDEVRDAGLEGLVEGVRAAVVDGADDGAGLQDGQGVGDEPVDDSDAGAEGRLREDVGEGEVRVAAGGSEFPQDLEVGVGGEDGAETGGDGTGVVLVGGDVAAQVDQDRRPLLEPFRQVRVAFCHGGHGKLHRAAEGHVGWDEEREVDFWEGGTDVVRRGLEDVEDRDHGPDCAGGKAELVDRFQVGVVGEGVAAAKDTVDVREDQTEGEGEGVAGADAGGW